MDVAIEIQGTGALRVISPEPWYREGQQIRVPQDQALVASTTNVRPTAQTGPADIDLVIGIGAGDVLIREVRAVETDNDGTATSETDNDATADTDDADGAATAPRGRETDSTLTTDTIDEE